MCGPRLWRQQSELTNRKRLWWNRDLHRLSQFFLLHHIWRLIPFQGRQSQPQRLTNPRLTIWKSLTREPLHPKNKISNVKIPKPNQRQKSRCRCLLLCYYLSLRSYLNFWIWNLTFNFLRLSPGSEVVLPHQRLKIWPQHSYLFSRSGDIPLMAL